MKILEQKGVEITNIEGARFNNFISGGKNGVLKGVLNECRVYLASSNVVCISTGEILVQGIRIQFTEEQSFSMTSTPFERVHYHVIAKVVRNLEDISVEIQLRPIQALQQQSLYQEDSGIYEIELIRFVHETSGTLSNVTRVIKTIDGSTGSSVPTESPNMEYVTTARLKYFEYGNEETYNYKNFDYESITAGKYLVLGDITVNFNYYYEGYGMQPSIAKGAVTTVVDLSPNSGETVTMEFRMPCNWEYDDETFEYSILPIFINMLNGGTDIAFGGGWDDLVDYDCTLTFIKIG